MPAAERSTAWVCGSSLAGIAGSNPVEVWIIVSCKCRVLYREGPLPGADPSSRDIYYMQCISSLSFSCRFGKSSPVHVTKAYGTVEV